MKPTVNRRRSLFVRLLGGSQPELRLLGRHSLVLLASFVFFVTLSLTLPAAIGYLAGTPLAGITELLRRSELLLTAVLLPLAATLLALFGFGLREVLRLAGPERRLIDAGLHLQQLSLPRGLKVRRDDYLQLAVKELNLGLERLHDEVGELQSIAASADVTDPAACQVALTKLQLRLAGIARVTALPEAAVVHAPEASQRAAAEMTVG